VIRDGATLPPRCIRTNQPVGPGDWTLRSKVSWTPLWVMLAMVVSSVSSKEAVLNYSMSRAARKSLVQRRSMAYLVTLAGMLAWVIAIFLPKGIAQGVTIVGGGTLITAGLLLLTLSNTFTVTKFRNGWFTLKGCSQEFLDSL